MKCFADTEKKQRSVGQNEKTPLMLVGTHIHTTTNQHNDRMWSIVVRLINSVRLNTRSVRQRTSTQGLKLRLWRCRAFCRDLGNPSHLQHLVQIRGGVHEDDPRGIHRDTATHDHDHDTRLVHCHAHDHPAHLFHHGRQCFHLHDEDCPQSGCQCSARSSVFHDVHHIPTMQN